MALRRAMRFRTELLVVFLGLFLVVQTISFVVTRTVSERNARMQVTESLAVAGDTLARLMADRERHLLDTGRQLAGDFAFKATFASGERDTILSMLANHGSRIDADAMALVSVDDVVIADTLRAQTAGDAFGHPWLIERALEHPEGLAAGVLFVNGRPLEYIVLPLFTPHHVAWLAIGFRLDDSFVAPLKSLTRAEVSLVTPETGTVHASTLAGGTRLALENVALDPAGDGTFELMVGGRDYLATQVPLAGEGEPMVALVMRPLDEAFAPYRELETWLIVLFALGLVVASVGAGALARNLSRPLAALTAGARRVADGDYSHRVELDRRDELGELAHAFNDMSAGLADRDRVRDLLGMVVSPAIADELLQRDIHLGGEEREVTVLFADCLGGARLTDEPELAQALERLNDTLTTLTDVVQRHGGVVDKYVAGGVLALFGAPLQHEDDPARAVACALEMVDTMKTAHADRHLGIGIDTGRVVAGNIGSTRRLSYTVVGSAVQLAPRIAALTASHGVSVLVTDATRAACGDAFRFTAVGQMFLRGRADPVALHEPERR